MPVPIYSSGINLDLKIKGGYQTVVTAGNPVQLSSDPVFCTEILIQSSRTNTGRIYVGGSDVNNSDTNGVVLNPPPAAGLVGDSIRMYATNLDQIYLDAQNNGETVTYIYWADRG